MANVITSEPKSVTVAAPQWAVHVRKYAVEAIGAFFLTFVVAVSVLSHSVFTPLAAGAALMVMIYAGGHISGGHYNPAVTMGALVRGRIGIGDAVPYWIAQVVGGVVAGVIARAVVNPAAVKTLTLSGHVEAAASVVELVFKDMPNNPLPCVRRLFFSHKGRGWEKVFQISGSPAGQGVSDHVPGLLKHGNQFSGLTY